MKPRRVIITIEAETDLPLATLRDLDSIEVTGADGCPDYLFAHDGEGCRIVQVQVNAIQPVRKPYKLPKSKRMVPVSVRPSSMEPVHTGNTTPGPADLIDMTQDGPHPAVAGGKRIRTMKATRIPRGKAKRAKGAK